MKRIKIFRSFFTPDNRLLKAGVHMVADDWLLPKGTEILEEVVDAVKDAVDDEPVVKKTAGK